jgi:hypothetical protein
MRDVRSYAPKQTVLWPRCSHDEFCVMQVYQGRNNSGRHFWQCPGTEQLQLSLLAMPICMGKQCPQFFLSSFFGLVTFSCVLQYSTQVKNCGFSQWVDPPTIDPYLQYIDYLEDVVIYNLKHQLSEALPSPDPSSSAGEDRCCKCSTCTCECHKKDWSPLPSPLPPPPGYCMSLQHSGSSMLSELFSYN